MSFAYLYVTLCVKFMVMDTTIIINGVNLTVESFTTLVAEAIIKKTNPQEDFISTTQAEKFYGKSFINRAKASGILPVKHGNKNAFSRHALDSYYATGMMQPEEYCRSTRGRKKKFENI